MEFTGKESQVKRVQNSLNITADGIDRPKTWSAIENHICGSVASPDVPALSVDAYRVALCVGHSRLVNGKPEGGAVSVDGVSEWDYNCELASMISCALEDFGIASKIYSRYDGSGYTAAMNWLAEEIRRDNNDLAVELHFNSADEPANGHEWLYWYTSQAGETLAKECRDKMVELVPQIRSRGIKPITSGSDRGGSFLIKTHCPAIICEPFFGSNHCDADIAETKKDDIAEAIARGIKEYFRM